MKNARPRLLGSVLVMLVILLGVARLGEAQSTLDMVKKAAR